MTTTAKTCDRQRQPGLADQSDRGREAVSRKQSPAPRGPNIVLDAIVASGADVRDFAVWPALMDQEAASAFLLHVCAVKLAPRSLQKRRVVGASPPFRKLGVRVAYPRDLLKAWGDAQAGPVVHSTSELTAS